jgi:hypothetical protein
VDQLPVPYRSCPTVAAHESSLHSGKGSATRARTLAWVYLSLVIRATIRFSYPLPTHEEEPVATLYCPCGKSHELWGEFWWTEGRYQWIFFDYEQASETYAKQVENCPACGRRLERKNLLS